MRARSIHSLTPAVYLDYRDINRPGLAGSGSEKLTADCQTDRERRLDADTWQKQQQQHEEAEQNSSEGGSSVLLCRSQKNILNLNFFRIDAAWQGIAGRSGFFAKTRIFSSTQHKISDTATLRIPLEKNIFFPHGHKATTIQHSQLVGQISNSSATIQSASKASVYQQSTRRRSKWLNATAKHL